MVDLRDLPLIVEIGGAAATLLAAWWAGVRYVWPRLQVTGQALSGLMSLGTQADSLIEGLSRTEQVERLLRQVKHEVMPNGGASLRDAINRTESTVALLVAQQRARDDAEDDIVRLDADADGRVTWMAGALMRWTERTSDELKGYGWMSFVHPDDREDVADEYSRCIRHSRQFDAAFRLIDRSGDITMVRMSAVPVQITGTTRWTATMKIISAIPGNLAPPERASGGRQ